MTPEDPMFDTRDGAVIIGGNPRTMERWRVTGEGPEFVKIGKLVRYRKSSLERFVTERTRRHTGDTSRVA